MALEITVRDHEKQTEVSKMVCKCALLSMDEAGGHGDARTIVFSECDALSIAETILRMEQEIEEMKEDPDIRRAVDFARWLRSETKHEKEKMEPEAQEPDISFAVKVARVPRKGGER